MLPLGTSAAPVMYILIHALLTSVILKAEKRNKITNPWQER